jgi:hypothetical protein
MSGGLSLDDAQSQVPVTISDCVLQRPANSPPWIWRLPPLPSDLFSFVVQYIESPSVLRRDVVEDVGIPRDVRRLEGPSLGGERVNTELSSERANANKLWHRDGARREFTEAVGHLIVGEASSREVAERTIRCDHDEENGHTPFVDDVMDSEALRSFDTLVLGS